MLERVNYGYDYAFINSIPQLLDKQSTGCNHEAMGSAVLPVQIHCTKLVDQIFSHTKISALIM